MSEHGGPRLLACCAVWLEEHLPGPGNPNGLRGHIAGMVTEPASRHRTAAHAFYRRLGYEELCDRSGRFMRSLVPTPGPMSTRQ
jgi:hypothetical protein